ncbi:MAG: RNA 2',3'-cyclic phosphodiesterase [Thermoplasmata archaeon]|jgi:2'-5' RNA ligase|nr:MAG: RNA 2',3'-cyclic phosphodiesterase [Thermoplasmata archaeon]RLF64759.1 MAG: RNA 2',3'-cyclic phosphodiesterase [Thermoplasmata archaeon]
MRSFISIDVGAMDSLVSLEKELGEAGVSLKLVEPENIHLTLKFLGEIDEELVPKIEEAMREAVNGIEPFTAELVGTGAFPSLDYMKVVWVGMRDSGETKKIAGALEESLQKYGFRREKRFTPHVTLARVKGARGKEKLREILSKNMQKNFGKVRVESIRLKKSELRKEGPLYTTLLDVKL